MRKSSVAAVAIMVCLSASVTTHVWADPAPAGTGAATAPTEAEKLAALKAMVEAQRDIEIARNQRDAARVGQLPAFQGTITPDISAGTNAGKGEASLLANAQLTRAARAISGYLKPTYTGQTILVLGPSEDATSLTWSLFSVASEAALDYGPAHTDKLALDAEFARLGDLTPRAAPAAPSGPPPPPKKAQGDAVSVGVGAAGAVLGNAVEILKLLQVDDTVEGVPLTADENVTIAALQRALAQDGMRVISFANLNLAAAAKKTAEEVMTITSNGDAAQEEAGAVEEQAQKLTAAAEEKANAPRRDTLVNLAERCTKLATRMRRISGLTQVVRATMKDGDKSTAYFKTVVSERARADLFPNAPPIVFRLNKTELAGGYYTRKSLFGFIGGPPMWVMGSAVISYTLADQLTGQVLTGGVVAEPGKYVRLLEYDTEVRR